MSAIDAPCLHDAAAAAVSASGSVSAVAVAAGAAAAAANALVDGQMTTVEQSATRKLLELNRALVLQILARSLPCSAPVADLPAAPPPPPPPAPVAELSAAAVLPAHVDVRGRSDKLGQRLSAVFGLLEDMITKLQRRHDAMSHGARIAQRAMLGMHKTVSKRLTDLQAQFDTVNTIVFDVQKVVLGVQRSVEACKKGVEVATSIPAQLQPLLAEVARQQEALQIATSANYPLFEILLKSLSSVPSNASASAVEDSPVTDGCNDVQPATSLAAAKKRTRSSLSLSAVQPLPASSVAAATQARGRARGARGALGAAGAAGARGALGAASAASAAGAASAASAAGAASAASAAARKKAQQWVVCSQAATEAAADAVQAGERADVAARVSRNSAAAARSSAAAAAGAMAALTRVTREVAAVKQQGVSTLATLHETLQAVRKDVAALRQQILETNVQQERPERAHSKPFPPASSRRGVGLALADHSSAPAGSSAHQGACEQSLQQERDQESRRLGGDAELVALALLARSQDREWDWTLRPHGVGCEGMYWRCTVCTREVAETAIVEGVSQVQGWMCGRALQIGTLEASQIRDESHLASKESLWCYCTECWDRVCRARNPATRT